MAYALVNEREHRFQIGELDSGTGLITWGSSTPVLRTTVEGATLVPHPALAGGYVGQASNCAYVLGLQYLSTDPMSDENKVRVANSSDTGQTFAALTLANLNTSGGGFVAERDARMAQYHISADPGITATRERTVYAFYVRTDTFLGPFIANQNVLVCRASHNDGQSWNSEQVVFPTGYLSQPTNGYAPVPPNNSPGFYRMGRVWSCVDGQGRVHVVWFDNRAGRLGSEPMGQDINLRDRWRVYRSMSTDGGATWSTPVVVSEDLSMGGFGIPETYMPKHAPPGDFISCDADWNRLYIAWNDTRDWDNSDPVKRSRIYVRTIEIP